MNLSRLISLAVLASLTQLGASAHAAGSDPPPTGGAPETTIERWPLAVAMGGGLNASGRPTGEATFLPDLAGPYVSVGYSNAGNGRRAYVEAGVSLFVSLAAGVGYHLDSTDTPRWGFHVFAGIPVPLIGLGPDGTSTPFTSRVHISPFLLYLEPFYRPEFRKGTATEHETGLLLKVRIGLTKRQWSLPGFDATAGLHDL